MFENISAISGEFINERNYTVWPCTDLTPEETLMNDHTVRTFNISP